VGAADKSVVAGGAEGGAPTTAPLSRATVVAVATGEAAAEEAGAEAAEAGAEAAEAEAEAAEAEAEAAESVDEIAGEIASSGS
jgi:hypothetical protein